MNRAYAAGLLLVLSLTAIQAQDIPAPLSIHTGQVLRGHFVLTRKLKGFRTPLHSEGTFTLSPENGLIWTVTTPYATRTVATETGLFQLNTDARLTPASGQSISWQNVPTAGEYYAMLSNILAGSVADLQKNFRIRQNGRSTNWRMSLVPRKWGNPLLPFREIRIRGARYAQEIILIKTEGDRDRLTLDTVVTGPNTLTADERETFARLTP